MRFLVDAQLPPALARWLTERGHEASHVVDHQLAAAKDIEIWRFATALGAIVVTKDEDFVYLHRGRSTGPAVVWVRVGNTTRRSLVKFFESVWPRLEHALLAGETLVELQQDAETTSMPH